MTDLRIDRVTSPMGDLQLVTHRNALCALDFADRDATMRERLRERFGDVELREENDPAGHATRLRAYIAGDLHALDGTLVETGGTEFQQRVWSALRDVPSGTTKTYAEIAEAVGQPGAAGKFGYFSVV